MLYDHDLHCLCVMSSHGPFQITVGLAVFVTVQFARSTILPFACCSSFFSFFFLGKRNRKNLGSKYWLLGYMDPSGNFDT